MDLEFMILWEAGYDLPPTTPKPQPREKGTCRHCGKKIGRGVHFHEKACEAQT